MCIRDRRRVLEEMDSIGVSSLGIVTLISVFMGAVITIQTVYNPVSYTHLRAHETVLDLVCRLLLENKKNNKTKKKKKTNTT